MIGKIVSGIFKLVIVLINVILAPIDLMIENTMPTVTNALSAINSMTVIT